MDIEPVTEKLPSESCRAHVEPLCTRARTHTQTGQAVRHLLFGHQAVNSLNVRPSPLRLALETEKTAFKRIREMPDSLFFPTEQ